MPLEDSGKTGDDLVTDQEAIASVDQPDVDIPQPREASSCAPTTQIDVLRRMEMCATVRCKGELLKQEPRKTPS